VRLKNQSLPNEEVVSSFGLRAGLLTYGPDASSLQAEASTPSTFPPATAGSGCRPAEAGPPGKGIPITVAWAVREWHPVPSSSGQAANRPTENLKPRVGGGTYHRTPVSER